MSLRARDRCQAGLVGTVTAAVELLDCRINSRGDKPEKLVLEDGATQREAGLLHGQVADRFRPRDRGEILASVAAASRPKA